MPVIVNTSAAHPFLPSTGNPDTIEDVRAIHQDFRPLEIAVLNLMADKQGTERQLAVWLGHSPLQVRLTFVATDSYMGAISTGEHARHQHIRDFYKPWSEIRVRKFDGLLVTGVNLLGADVTKEGLWPEIEEICAWSDQNVLSTFFLCWSGFAALKHFHGIESHSGNSKLLGVFDHYKINDRSDLLFGMPDIFPVPVGRWQRLATASVEGRELELISSSVEGEAFLLADNCMYGKARSFPRRVYMLNHPEYDTATMKVEYLRDLKFSPDTKIPYRYFPDDNPDNTPINTWRHVGNIYVNWIKTLYDATPYNLGDIPKPMNTSFCRET